MKTERLLLEVEEQTKKLIELAKKNFLPLNEQALNQKPSPSQWSVAECLEHLNYYSNYYNKNSLLAIKNAKGKQRESSKDFKSSWLGKKSVQMVEPTNTKKMKAQKFLNPSLSKVEANVVDRFIKGQEEFLTLIHKSKQVNLKKVRVPMEIMKLLKLPLGDILLFMVAHHQRHCNQALKVIGLF